MHSTMKRTLPYFLGIETFNSLFSQARCNEAPNFVLKKIVFLILTFLITSYSYSQTPDFKIQHLQFDVPGSGLTITAPSNFLGVSDINKAFIIISNNRRNGAGPEGNQNTVEARGISCSAYFSNSNTIIFSRGAGATITTRVNIMIVEYIGAAGGPNEIIVRHRGPISPAAGTTVQSQTMSTTPANINKCIPFYSVQTTDTQNGGAANTLMLYCSGTNILNYHRGGAANTVSARVEVVEFTGSNWSVGHGDSGSGGSNSGTITLNTSATGTGGSIFNVGSYSNAFIWHTYKGDSNSGSNESIVDNYPVYTPNGTTQVNWSFANGHAGVSERHFVHVLANSGMNVTRFSDSQNSANESLIDISTAGLTDLGQSLILGSSTSSGGGTAYGRGWRNYYFNSLNEVAHWSHRSGNTMLHEIQIIDFIGLSKCPYIIKTTPSSRCGSGTLVLNAKASAGNIKWYATATDGLPLGSGSSFTTPSISTTTTYYVDATNNGCISAIRTAVVATIKELPTITSTTSGSTAGSGTVKLGASASAGIINWYAAATGGVSLATGNSFTTPSISVTTTYYVEAVDNGCITNFRTPVVATVYCTAGSNNISFERIVQLQIGTINNSSTVNANGYSDFTSLSTNMDIGKSYPITVTNAITDASSQVGIWIDWNHNGVFTDSGEFFGTTIAGDKFSSTIIPPIAAKIGSSRMRVRIIFTGILDPCGNASYGEVEDYTLNVVPIITGVTPNSRCGTGQVTLGAAGTVNSVINWYSVPSGGTSLASGTSFTTGSLTNTTSYWVDATYNGFTTSSRTEVIATVASCINKWKGTISNDWNTPGNWTQNLVPAADANIIFDDAPANHCLLDQDRSVTDITNAQSTYGIVLNGKKLTVKGNLFFTNGASIDASASNSTMQFSGTTGQTIDTGVFKNDAVYNLNMDNSNNVLLNGNLRLLNNLTSTAGLLDAFTNSPLITYAGSTLQTIGSNQFLGGKVYDLTIDNAIGVNVNTNFAIVNELVINLGKKLSISSLYQLTANGSITNNGSTAGLVLKSDATGTASLIHNTNNVPATVQRYISGPVEGWHFLSSPVSNQSISGSWLPAGSYGTGNILTGTGYDLYLWDEPTWSFIYKLDATWNTKNPSTNFNVGRGYLYSVQATNPTKEFQGNLNNGTINYPITITTTVDPALVELKGFNLVGNPYPSSVDWQAASGWDRSKLEVSVDGYDVWVWNPTANNYGVFNSVSLVGTNSISRYLAPMQGYFVKAAGTGNLGFDNSVRTHTGAGNWFKNSRIKNGVIRVTVESEDSSGTDEALIQFGYSDSKQGATKLFSHVATVPSLYMRSSNKDYSVRYMTDTAENTSVPVEFKAGKDGFYNLAFNFDSKEFDFVQLEDRLLKTYTSLKSSSSIRFKASITDSASRFVLHFTETDTIMENELAALVYMGENKLVVDLKAVSNQTEVKLFDITGKLILRKKLDGSKVHELELNLATQILLIRLSNEKGTFNTKVLYDSLK